MLNIYELDKKYILDVKGEYEFICEDENNIYVRAENLDNPFKISSIPLSYELSLTEELNKLKEQKINEMNAKCDELLTEFSSSALGEEYIYDAKLEDQLNLMGLVSANIDSFFRCRKKEGLKANIEHTKEQLKQVYIDGLTYKSEIIYICGVLKAYILEQNSKDVLQDLQWEDYKKIQESKNV